MKNKSQKILIVFIIVVLLITSGIAIYLSSKNKDDIVETPIKEQEVIVKKEISELTDEETYFDIELTLNDYYEENFNYEMATFIVKDIYYNPGSDITYFFINGYLYTQEIDEGPVTYNSNVNYLIIEKENNYVLNKLDNISDIESYAKNYDINEVDVDSSKRISSSDMSEENKMSAYINEFLNLLYLDNQRAYNMLTDETKAKYINYEEFYNQRAVIYNSLSTKIFAYSKKEEDEYLIYFVQDKNQTSIKLIEYRPKDFKIGY